VGERVGGERIAVGPGGVAWMVNDSNDIYKRENGNWNQIPGKARALAIGGLKSSTKTTLFSLGLSKLPGGYEIFTYSEFTKKWKSLSRGAITIAVSPQGNLWYVTSDYRVFRQ
jgi:hypothetical protein